MFFSGGTIVVSEAFIHINGQLKEIKWCKSENSDYLFMLNALG